MYVTYLHGNKFSLYMYVCVYVIERFQTNHMSNLLKRDGLKRIESPKEYEWLVLEREGERERQIVRIHSGSTRASWNQQDMLIITSEILN